MPVRGSRRRRPCRAAGAPCWRRCAAIAKVLQRKQAAPQTQKDPMHQLANEASRQVRSCSRGCHPRQGIRRGFQHGDWCGDCLQGATPPMAGPFRWL